jgi:hypothetical protein
MGLPNTTGVEVGKDYPPIKSDWYPLIFSDDKEATNKDGHPYTKITFDFEDGNRKAWCNLSHGEKSLWMVKKFKLAIGMGDAESDLSQYRGTRVIAFVQDDEYQGKHYPKVTDFKVPEISGIPDIDDGLPF